MEDSGKHRSTRTSTDEKEEKHEKREKHEKHQDIAAFLAKHDIPLGRRVLDRLNIHTVDDLKKMTRHCHADVLDLTTSQYGSLRKLMFPESADGQTIGDLISGPPFNEQEMKQWFKGCEHLLSKPVSFILSSDFLSQFKPNEMALDMQLFVCSLRTSSFEAELLLSRFHTNPDALRYASPDVLFRIASMDPKVISTYVHWYSGVDEFQTLCFNLARTRMAIQRNECERERLKQQIH